MFEKEIRVQESDLDALKHVNNVRYVDWVQEVALAHWHEKAPKEMREKWVWVMTKHCIEYKKAAVLDNHILIKTYLEAAKGPIANRIVEFYIENDQYAAIRSTTTWCLLDAASMKPRRIPENVAEVFYK